MRTTVRISAFTKGFGMKNIRSWGLSAIAALLLAACGGGDPDVPGSGAPAGAGPSQRQITGGLPLGGSRSLIAT
jgi:hypothetical protein